MKKQKRRKNFLAMLLAASMIFQQVPVTVLAADSEQAVTEQDQTEKEAEAAEAAAQAESERAAAEAAAQAESERAAAEAESETQPAETEAVTETETDTESESETEIAAETETETESESESESETEETELISQIQEYEADVQGIHVKVSALEEEMRLPAGTDLEVKILGEDGEAVQAAAAADGDVTVTDAFALDISLTADGEAVHPDIPVKVDITFDSPVIPAKDGETLRDETIKVYHILDQKAVDTKAETQQADKGSIKSVSFTTESFSPFVIVRTVPKRTVRVYTYEDGQVSVTATLQKAEAVPDDADFRVTRVDETTGGYNYDAYMKALNNAAGEDEPEYTDKNTLLYDIAFMIEEVNEEGNKTGKWIEYEPEEGSVTIQISFKQKQLSEEINAEEAKDIEVIHLPLTDEVRDNSDSTMAATDISAGDIRVEKVDADVTVGNHEAATFTTDDFSVFAVTNTDEKVKVQIQFTEADGSTPDTSAKNNTSLTDGSYYLYVEGKKLIPIDASAFANGDGSVAEIEIDGLNAGNTTIGIAVRRDPNSTEAAENLDTNNKHALLKDGDTIGSFYKLNLPDTLNKEEGSDTIIIKAEKNSTASGNFESVLGDSVNFGITANTITLGGTEIQSNFAAKDFATGGAERQVKPNLSGNSGAIVAGDVSGGGKLKLVNENGPDNVVVYTTQDVIADENGNSKIVNVDFSDPKYIPTEKDQLDAYVDGLISYVKSQSASLAGSINYVPYTQDNGNEHHLDVTAFGDSETIVVDGSKIAKYITSGGGRLKIYKKAGQTVVINLPGDTVEIGEFDIIVDGTSVSSAPEQGIGGKNVQLDALGQGIIWNMPNATSVTLSSTVGVFLAPNAAVNLGGTTTGWLVADSFTNTSGEWHFPYGSLPQDIAGSDEASVRLDKLFKEGSVWPEGDEFTFKVEALDTYEVNGLLTPSITVAKDAPSKDIAFKYSALAGENEQITYTFKVTEDASSDDSVVIDDRAWYIRVTVNYGTGLDSVNVVKVETCVGTKEVQPAADAYTAYEKNGAVITFLNEVKDHKAEGEIVI